MFLVTGATGGLGRRVIRLLREQSQPVRALVRLTANYAELEHRGAQICIGSLLRSPDLQRACTGIQYVISTHSASEAAEGDVQAIDYQANIDLIDQAKAEGVEHFVFVSALGVDQGYDDAPVFKAKRAVEKYLVSSGLNYTVLRPASFASSLLSVAQQFRQTGVYLLIGNPQHRTSIVSPDDLAQIAIAAPTTQGACNQIFAVGGPEVLHRGEIPKILGRVMQREPMVMQTPLLGFDSIRTVIGLFNPKTHAELGTLRVLLAHEFFCTTNEIEQLQAVFNLQLETLESFLHRSLNP
ncbi:oxidoreductase [Neosynechococcus sphagnicola sy1]|uniref:Oxidoreductase n=1 Tax=Neosynechococcus sphagnicola sy1 TaxID=1497020 RepID=A0A098TNJ9_9CYAN|nr:SDR family oxidoreductase [Neosynechococcus sphagnicola]KGF72413.1 oxidoreductase [Neosynechococcus sphagnicola sy1]